MHFISGRRLEHEIRSASCHQNARKEKGREEKGWMEVEWREGKERE